MKGCINKDRNVEKYTSKTRQSYQYRPISEFDGRMFSIMSDGTPDGTEIFKYKGHIPEYFIKWAPLPDDPEREQIRYKPKVNN